MSQARAAVQIRPEEYLAFAARSDLHAEWGAKYSLTVSGSVEVTADAAGITTLPPATIKGDLTLSPKSRVTSILCSVTGDVKISGTRVRELGPEFRAGGHLDARDCRQITSLRGRFPGGVDLSGSGVKFLGEDLTCGDYLHVQNCPGLETLDCTVRGSVFANQSSLRELGPNFHCGGSLGLLECANLRGIGAVKGPPRDILLSGSGVVCTFAGFFCRGDLVAQGCSSLEKLLGGVGGTVTVERAERLGEVSIRADGSVSLSQCPALETVHLTTNGDASFHRCGMETLSNRTSVTGELHISQCENFRSIGGRWGGSVNLQHLPSLRSIDPDFKCEHGFVVRGCENLESVAGQVGGTAELVGTGKVSSIGPDFSVGGTLFLECMGGDLKSVGCAVEGDAKITGSGDLRETLVSFSVGGDAVVEHLQNFRVMRGRVGGSVRIKQSGIEKIGADFECGGSLTLEGCPDARALNCRVGGDAVLDGAPKVVAGPAFHCGGKTLRAEYGKPGRIRLGNLGRGKKRLVEVANPKLLSGAAANAGMSGVS